MSRDYLSQLRLSIQATAMACALLFALSATAFADCATGSDNPNGTPTCAYVLNNNVAVTVAPTAFLISANDTTPRCKKVTNGCTATIMVPTGNESEWVSFLNNHETCATLATCSTLSIVLSASPSSVLSNGSTSLSWTITRLAGSYGTITCQASSTDIPTTWSSPYSYPTSVALPGGSATVTPNPTSNSTTTYTLSCQDSNNVPASGSVLVTVDQGLAVSISANPSTVTPGGSTVLSYSVTDSSAVPYSCTASNTDGDGVWTGTIYSNANTTLSGTKTVIPAPTGTQTSVRYTLTCTDNLQPSGVAKYVDVGLACAASAPTNGSLSAYPDCAPSCNAGYVLQSDGTCKADCAGGVAETWTNSAATLSCSGTTGSSGVLSGSSETATATASGATPGGSASFLCTGNTLASTASAGATCACGSGYTLQNGACVANTAPTGGNNSCSGGYEYNNYCYRAGPQLDSCDAACASHGGCNSAGTAAVDSASCPAVMQGLGYGGIPAANSGSAYSGLGCSAITILKEETGKGAGGSSAYVTYVYSSSTSCSTDFSNVTYVWCTPGDTLPDGSPPLCSRVCACNN